MATRNYKVLDYSHAPEARPFAGREVTIEMHTEKGDIVRVRLCRAHAAALRGSIDQTLTTLDQIAASEGVGPKEARDAAAWQAALYAALDALAHDQARANALVTEGAGYERAAEDADVAKHLLLDVWARRPK